MKLKINKGQTGITLIALVVTIIVLLILAGVSISMLMGQNGILNRAVEAKTRTIKENEKEEIALIEYEAKMDNNSKNIESILRKKLSGRAKIFKDNEKIIISYIDSGNLYVAKDEKLEELTDITGTIIEKMNLATKQDINGKIVYAIDSDGKDVDMNYWEYCYDTQTNGYALNDKEVLNNREYGGDNTTRIRNKGYLGNFTSNGEIIGNIPAYIKESGDWEEVTSMYNTFYECTDLKIGPEIPSSVTCMWSTYQNCSNLIEGKIGENVENLRNCFYPDTALEKVVNLSNCIVNMVSTFENCTSLKSIPEIPNTVIYMNSVCAKCSSLLSTPYIPSSVINMNGAFQYCTSLKEITNIGENVTNLDSTFYSCTELIKAPEIPDKVQIMRSTFNTCKKLETPPAKIPESVVNMVGTFIRCEKLSGTIEINANMTTEVKNTTENAFISGKNAYDQCFYKAAKSGNGLKITTKSEVLKANNYEVLREMAAENASKITLQQY